jgi:hypothetical protein
MSNSFNLTIIAIIFITMMKMILLFYVLPSQSKKRSLFLFLEMSRKNFSNDMILKQLTTHLHINLETLMRN